MFESKYSEFCWCFVRMRNITLKEFLGFMMIKLKRKKIQSADMFPVCMISVLCMFGFCICSIHISSFYQVGRCIYAFFRA